MEIPDQLVKELLGLLDENDSILSAQSRDDWEELQVLNEHRRRLWELKHKIEEKASDKS